MNVKDLLKFGFALIVVVMYMVGAGSTLSGAHNEPDFSPNSFTTFLVDSAGAALVVFISAQLGIAIAAAGVMNLRAGIQTAMGTKLGMIMLILDFIVFVVIGALFMAFAAFPETLMATVPNRSTPVKVAPEYIVTQAKLFVTVAIAGGVAFGTTEKLHR